MLINLRNALMAGKRTPTAKDCPALPNLLYWDGIENAAWGVHDASATTWKDLIGGYACPISSNASVLADCLATASSLNLSAQKLKIPQALVRAINAGVLTIEFVGTLRCGSTNGDGIAGVFYSSAIRPLTVYAASAVSGTARRIRGSMLATSGTTVGPSTEIATRNNVRRFSMSIVFNSGTMTTYLNGAYIGANTYAPSQSASATTSMDLTLMYSTAGGNYFDGEACALRFHSSALSADKIAANYAFDKARFGLS